MFFIRSNDGIHLAVEDINPTSSKVIVMVHGWPMNKNMFEYQKNMLVEWGYRIVSFDIRGFGNSDVSDHPYQYDQLATDLFFIIENLKLNNVILLGFSMGGAICVHYMGMYDNYHVSQLILVSAAAPSFVVSVDNPYGHQEEELNNMITNLYTDRPKTLAEFNQNMFASMPSAAFRQWIQNMGVSSSSIATIRTAQALRDENVFTDLSRIKVPTAIMHGKLDKICPYGFALIMNQQIPNSSLYAFENSGHGIFFDELSSFNHTLINICESSITGNGNR